jgi:histidyl-tRNA synthetase
MDKQLKYANAKKIPFVAFVGDEEIKKNTIQLKNMNTGEQSVYSIQQVIEKLKQ